MESPEILSSCNSHADSNDSSNVNNPAQNSSEDYTKLQDQVIANFQKPNLPNVNVPEKIVFCLDVCHDGQNSLYRLGDGTSFTPMNMLKRVLDFFIHTKHAINKKTEFALLVLKDTEAVWVQNFTNNINTISSNIFTTIDFVSSEESTSEYFDFKKVFQILMQKIEVPQYTQGECILPPPYVSRMIVLYGRSNCIPIIPMDDPYFKLLKKQVYFYIDILLAHEDECALYKCEDIYDALQDLDDGYSYVYEVSRNATKIHDCIAKLLAHPLQRPLQKNTDYSFGSRY